MTDPQPAQESTSVADCSLAGLLVRVAAGCRDAFEQLYKTMAGPVFRRAAAIVRDVGHAEEVTQEVFLEIWQRAGTFDRTLGSAASWMMRMTHARSVDRVRHVQAGRRRETTFIRDAVDIEHESLLDGCIRRAEWSQVGTAVSELTALQQEAITMTVYRGYSFREASEILGIPLPTLKTRVRGGLIALRRTPTAMAL
jgi:RNA polymerase sigma-70 factor (ECF subfamily)